MKTYVSERTCTFSPHHQPREKETCTHTDKVKAIPIS